jgi:hypothetical protein
VLCKGLRDTRPMVPQPRTVTLRISSIFIFDAPRFEALQQINLCYVEKRGKFSETVSSRAIPVNVCNKLQSKILSRHGHFKTVSGLSRHTSNL